MDISEVSIGDWIKFQGREIKCGRAVFCDEYADCTIEPIPLTEEFLEKNGFKKSDSVSDVAPFDRDEEGFMYFQYGNLGTDEKHIWFWYRDGEIMVPANCAAWIHISSVHGLQHLLRVVGLSDVADKINI